MKLTTILSILFLVGGCGSDDPKLEVDAGDDPDANSITTSAFALGSDFESSGILSRIEIDNEAVVQQDFVPAVAGSDAVIRRFDNRLFIVNRLGADNVTIVDIDSGTLVDQVSTGAGSNPQDVALVDDVMYICSSAGNQIIAINLNDTSQSFAKIDISSYDKDGEPNCGSIVYSGGRIFATLQLLDENFASSGGTLLVINPKTNTIEDSIDFSTINPLGFIATTEKESAFAGDLLVATVDWNDSSGCIQRVMRGTQNSAKCLVDNASLGGYAGNIQVKGDKAYVLVNVSFTESKLVTVAADGTVDGASITPSTLHATDFALCPSGHLVTNDTASGGVRVFNPENAEVTKSALDLGLPTAFANGMVCL